MKRALISLLLLASLIAKSQSCLLDGKADWENNYLNLDGWSELYWFPTENFTTLDSWREKILSGIL